MEFDPSDCRLKLAERAPYFSLRATDGKIYSLSDFSDAPALAVIFTANHCPYAQAYETRIRELTERFSAHGVRIVAICSNDGDAFPEDNFENMVEKSKSLGFSFPYLHDESQDVARAYDAKRTPECYLFDSEQKLCFHGAIDDNFSDAGSVEFHYLADAIRALLRDEPVPNSITPILGCTIKWKI